MTGPKTAEMHEPVQKWFKRNYLDEDSPDYVPDEMIYRKGGSRQLMFVRDRLTPQTCRGLPKEIDGEYKQWHEQACFVVSEHHSKSCPLPVYSIEPPGKGIRFILRDNFYNWKVSVISDKPIEIDATGIFAADEPVAPDYQGRDLSSVYFEGFPQDLIFGYYSESDKMKFSAQVGNDYGIFMFIFLVMRDYEGEAWIKRQEEYNAETLVKAEESRKERAAEEAVKVRSEAGI